VDIAFVYPAFERHAEAHPELLECVPANEYIGPPSLGIASVAAATPPGHSMRFIDDRVDRFDPDKEEADVFALSFFTPAATRGLEIADELRARGKTVVAGGIFPSKMPDVVAEHVDAVVVGEGEAAWAELVADLEKGELKPRYEKPVDFATVKPPRLDLYFGNERDGHRPDDYPLQISRGCPLQCSACVLPSMMGRKMRFHRDDYLVDTVKQFAAAGKWMSLTEDTSVTFAYGARRKFRKFLDLVLELQAQGIDAKFSYLGISMPMILHLDEDLLAKLRQTGMDRFYLVGGFDPITRKAFGEGDKKAMEKAERTINRCWEFDLNPYVSFLVGNKTDDEGVFDRMLEFSDRVNLQLAEFAISTPYPGTPQWFEYEEEGRIFDYTWKHYNDANAVFKPHNMSAERLQEGYLYLWREFYKNRQAGGGQDGEIKDREYISQTIQF